MADKKNDDEKGLTKEQEDQLKEAFKIFDTTGDGSIDADELKTILDAVG